MIRENFHNIGAVCQCLVAATSAENFLLKKGHLAGQHIYLCGNFNDFENKSLTRQLKFCFLCLFCKVLELKKVLYR